MSSAGVARARAGRADSSMGTWLVRAEPWLPIALAAAWWLAMYPGLFGEDSLINLDSARNGPVTVWFTAWWVYMIRAITFGTRAIPLLTLFGVVLLAFAARQWAAACLPSTPARAIAVCLVCASPLVGAFGIQIRHDVEMTAGLLLATAVVTRIAEAGAEWTAADIAMLVAAALLVPTRHNGVPTIAAAAVLWAVVGGPQRWRVVVPLAIVAVIGAVITEAATRASGNQTQMDPAQTIEWALTDVSCVLSKPGVQVEDEEWAVLDRLASRSDVVQADACRFMDKNLFNAPGFHSDVMRERASDLLRVWWRLAMRNPWLMITAHAERIRLFLPPFSTGLPRTDNLPFIHSTIMPNAFDLEWRFPRVAGTVRLVARAWNAATVVIANASVWLFVLAVAHFRGVAGVRLRPTLVVAVALLVPVLVTAPMSEGRYALFILIGGHVTLAWGLISIFSRTNSATSHFHA